MSAMHPQRQVIVLSFYLLIALSSIQATSRDQALTTSRVWTQHAQVFLRQIKYCITEKIVLVGEKDTLSSNSIIYNIFTKLVTSTFSVPLLHIEVTNNASIRNDVTNVLLKDELNNHRDRRLPTSYFLFSTRAMEILEDIERAFLRHPIYSKSLFPHRSKWMIFPNLHPKKIDITRIQTNSVLDNVVLVSYIDDDDMTSNHSRFVAEKSSLQISTFMWRGNHTRQPQQLDMERITNSKNKKCKLFPNIYFGMNQRKISATTKVGIYIQRVYNNITGSYGFSGWPYQIFHNLSEHLNFTYDISPPARDQPTNMSWMEMGRLVKQGKYNVGLGVWFYGADLGTNYSMTNPLMYDGYVGVYKQAIDKEDKAILILLPFKGLELVLIVTSVFYCIGFYLFIRLVICARDISEDVVIDDEKNKETNSDDNNALQKAQLSHKSKSQLCQTSNILLSRFLSFICDQDFPRPKLMSLRIVLFLLSFLLVIYYALYTGLLTATITSLPTKTRYSSWDDLVSDGPKKCRILTDGQFENMMFQGTLRRSLPKSIIDHCKEDYSKERMLPRLLKMLDSLDKNTILIFSKKAIEFVLNHVKSRQNFVVFPEELMNLNAAFLFQEHSEIEYAFSTSLTCFADTGLFTFNPFAEIISRQVNVTQKGIRIEFRDLNTKNRLNNENKVVIQDLKWLAVVTAASTLLSCVVLAAEWIVVRVRQCPSRQEDGGSVPPVVTETETVDLHL